MNESQTWFQLIPGYFDLWRKSEPVLARHWQWLLFGPTYYTLAHVLGAVIVTLFALIAGYRFYRVVKRGGDEAILPPRRFGLRALVEIFADGAFGLMVNVMGEKDAKRFLPFIGSLGFFIFFSNLLGLVPGFVPPTAKLQTNLALALTVFIVTHVWGVKEHGLAYFKHFLGPMLALAPLMVVIEIISHIARPVSLTLRLLGNMAADHKVVSIFTLLVPVLVPVPFLLLGILVSLIQALVFCLLSMVYIAMAVEHHSHDDHAHGEKEGHAHGGAHGREAHAH